MNHRRWIERRYVPAVLALIGAALPAGRAQEPPAHPPNPEACPALPAPLSGFSDEGVFSVYVNEERLVTIRFKWEADGSFENERSLTLAGQVVSSKMRILPVPDGQWCEISIQTPLGPVSITREDDSCRITRENEVETVTIKPGMVLLENFAPALMSQPVRLYDKAKGGKQSFPLLLLPERMMELSLELLDTVERSIGGCDVRFTRYRYALPDVGVDVILWTDEHGKLYLADVPAQHAAYVREGYEILRHTPQTDPLLSTADYETTLERNRAVPMRDGIELATDVYRPAADGRFPVILLRTPYKKELLELRARYFARRGYAFAVQDCRGRFGSPGTWEPVVNEAEDGYDAIEWLAVQPWSTGKVGMMGNEYRAWTQWLAAGRRPPHLVTIIPYASPPDPFYATPYDHGVFQLTRSIWWADLLESEATADLSGAAHEKIEEKNYHRLLRPLPVIELDKTVLGQECSYWRAWIAHPANDAYWARASFLDRLKDVDIPVFHQSGWFAGAGTKLNYLRMTSHGHPHQRLVVGPWGRLPAIRRRHGDRDFGPKAIVDLQRANLRWFDHWLKEVENGIPSEPLVNVFVMGSNRWVRGNTYPLPGTRKEKWYLASHGRANTSRGDGWLTTQRPRGKSRPDRYAYDPGDPTPDPGFYHESDEGPEGAGKKVRSAEEKKKARDAYHETIVRARRDILVYQSTRFDKPYTFAGPISARLYAASSARDTDWFVRLFEVDQMGQPFKLAEGKVRARYRNSTKDAELLEPGKVYEYHIDLRHTAITIPPDHRLRVEIASAAFPSFSRNLNTGGHNETETEYVTARQMIYHDARHPSHIVLPVIPNPAAQTD